MCFTAAAAFVVGSRPSPCSLARRERRQLRYAGVFHRFARFRAASALLQPLPSSSALMGRCRARLRRALPASLRWRFHRFARCKAASALPQPLPSSSALVGRRRARSRRASPASLRWRFHRCARCTGLHVLCRSRCLCRLGSRPSPCSLARRERCQLRYAGVFHRFARCRAASALLQPLPSSSALMGRCAVLA